MEESRITLWGVAFALVLGITALAGLPSIALAQTELQLSSSSLPEEITSSASIFTPVNDIFGTPKFCSMNFGTRLNGSGDSEYQSLQNTHFRDGTIPSFMNLIYNDQTRSLDWPYIDERTATAAASIDGSLHFHTVIWHHNNGWGTVGIANDGWYDNYERLSNAQRNADLKAYVQSTVTRFPEVDTFTLVNHPYRQPNRYPSYVNYMLTGKDRVDAIADIFRWANEANDSADYIVNEAFILSGESFNADIINQYIALINNVNSQLAPNQKIDGIGVQGHFGCWSGEIPAPDTIRQQLDKLYQSTGNLPIYITELDLGTAKCATNGPTLISNPKAPFNDSLGNVGNGGNTWPSWFEYQGWAYGELMNVFATHEGVKEVTLWDFYDGTTWRKDAGLFYDTRNGDYNYQPKPAYYAVKDYIHKLGCSDSPSAFIPGRIEAEAYDRYNDTDAVNRSAGTSYAAPDYTDGVDVAKGERDGYVVGWIKSGEWLEYNVNVTQATDYQVDLRLWAKNVSSLDLFDLYIDGNSTPAATFRIDDSSWINGFVTVTGGSISLPSGNHTIRLVMTGKDFNLDSVDFTTVTTASLSNRVMQVEYDMSIGDSLLYGEQISILLPLIVGDVE